MTSVAFRPNLLLLRNFGGLRWQKVSEYRDVRLYPVVAGQVAMDRPIGVGQRVGWSRPSRAERKSSALSQKTLSGSLPSVPALGPSSTQSWILIGTGFLLPSKLRRWPCLGGCCLQRHELGAVSSCSCLASPELRNSSRAGAFGARSGKAVASERLPYPRR